MRIFGRYGKRLGRRVSQLLYRVAPSLSSVSSAQFLHYTIIENKGGDLVIG